MQDKDFDQIFKQRFDDLEVEPSSKSWEKITNELDGTGKKRKTFPFYWMAAASVVLLASAVMWLYKPVELIKLQGKPTGQIVAIEKQLEDDSLPKQKIIDNSDKETIVTAPPVPMMDLVASRSTVKAGAEGAESKILKVSVNNVLVPLQKQTLVKKQDPEMQVENLNPTLNTQAQPVVLAHADDVPERNENYLDGEEEERPRIKSIGSLVNFVIGQVDKRDDKIIEFKDGYEGSQVSGINLGPLKFKSRK